MLQIRTQINSFSVDLMNTFYVVITVVGYQDVQWAKQMVMLFLERTQLSGHEECKRPL